MKHAAELANEFDSLLPAMGARARLPAFCVDVEVAGVRISRAYRNQTRRVEGEDRPVFAAGCLVDIFPSIVALELAHSDGLDLEAPLDQILPELRGLTGSGQPITLQHLLTRTSGLQEPRSTAEIVTYIPWPELAPRVLNTRRLAAPGSLFNYAGIDRILLSVALERFTGTGLRRLARRIAVDPFDLPIREAQFGPPEADGFRPIVAFDTAMLLDRLRTLVAPPKPGARGVFRQELSRGLLTERLRLIRSLKLQPWPHAPEAFTSGLFGYTDGLFGFDGWQENQSCAVRLHPQTGTSFIVAVEGPPSVRDAMVAQVADRLGFTSVQAKAIPCTLGGLNGLDPGDVIGSYDGWGEGHRAEVVRSGDYLVCHFTYRGARLRALRARLEEEAWLVSDSPAGATPLEFFREPYGRICFAQGLLPYSKTGATREGA